MVKRCLSSKSPGFEINVFRAFERKIGGRGDKDE